MSQKTQNPENTILSSEYKTVINELGLVEQVKLDGGGLRKNEGKLRTDLVPMSTLRSLARVLGKGAEKYEDNNWRRGMKWSTVQASLLRHLMLWIDGEDIDQESGLNHMDHIMANVTFLLEYIEVYPEGDDRFKRRKNE